MKNFYRWVNQQEGVARTPMSSIDRMSYYNTYSGSPSSAQKYHYVGRSYADNIKKIGSCRGTKLFFASGYCGEIHEGFRWHNNDHEIIIDKNKKENP